MKQPLRKEDFQVYAKEHPNSSNAIGVLHLSGKERGISLDFQLLGLLGYRTVQEVWRQKEESTFE